MQITEAAKPSARSDVSTASLRRLQQVSREVVGSAFFGTILKMSRDSKLKGAYGHGGRGEEIFTAQLHGVYAEQMGASMRTGLSDAIYRSLERQQRAMSRASGGGNVPSPGEGLVQQVL